MYPSNLTPPPSFDDCAVHYAGQPSPPPCFSVPLGQAALTPDASPEPERVTVSKPKSRKSAARRPIRQYGPPLLPRVRQRDDVTTAPSASGSSKYHRAVPPATFAYHPYARSLSVNSRSASPASTASSNFSTSLTLPSYYSSPDSRSSSVSTYPGPHCPSTFFTNASVSPAGYPLYQGLPGNIPQFTTNPAIQQPIPSGGPTTTILDYLSEKNPCPQLIPFVDSSVGHSNGRYFWWDVRNIRPWHDFSIEKINSIPGLMELLQIPVNAKSLPKPPSVNSLPGTKHDIHNIIHAHYGTKVTAALKLSQGVNHMSLTSTNSSSTSSSHVDFVSNYPTDYEKTIYGDKRSRVVGIVKPCEQWSASMRTESPCKQKLYLEGLAHLHCVMRDHGCRYGFIMSECELVCVRCGGDPADPSSQPINTGTSNVSLDSGSGVPYFGYLELSETINVDRINPCFDPETGEQTIRMTPALALWFLHMLAKEEKLIGIEASWRMDVGGPAAYTRSHACERDEWMPEIRKIETRKAKACRDWVLPEDALSRKELLNASNQQIRPSKTRKPIRQA